MNVEIEKFKEQKIDKIAFILSGLWKEEKWRIGNV